MKGPTLPELDISVEPDDDREAKLSLVRKLMLALKKDDEHAALDALDSLIEECGSKELDASALGDD